MDKKIKGLRRACLYSLPPSKAGACGSKDKIGLMSDFIISPNKHKVKEIEEILKEFRFAYGYYRQIAEAHDIDDVFNHKVIKTYWIGSKLLNKFLISGGEIPYHLYKVIFATTGGVELNEELYDLCRIGWGKVKNLRPDNRKAIVECNQLARNKKIFFLSGNSCKKEFIWNTDFLPKLKIGDWVSTHRGEIIEKLNMEELRKLEKCSRIILGRDKTHAII